MELGERIAAWRTVKGLSRDELAEKVGVTVAAVYQWEGTGEHKTKPSTDNLEKIAEAFGVTLERFYGRLPKPKARVAS